MYSVRRYSISSIQSRSRWDREGSSADAGSGSSAGAGSGVSGSVFSGAGAAGSDSGAAASWQAVRVIRDANLFVIQELLSEDHGKIQPGIYDLSTSMTAQEMVAVMAEDAPEEDEGNAE